MIVCGIDASSTCTGICFFQDGKLIFYDKFYPYEREDFRGHTCQIIGQVIEVVKKYSPDIIYMEDVPHYVGGRGVKPLIYLGCVQGIFYYELVYKLNYKIQFVDVYKWRQNLGFLAGERKRAEQKKKAIEFVNETFDLELKYKTSKGGTDDDIAEAICIAYSQMQDLS